MGWFEDVDAEPLSPGEQTYANQTEARERYYGANPDQAPAFSANQQAGLDDILARDQATRPAVAPATDPYAAERAAIAAHPENAPQGGIEQQFRNLWMATPDHSPEALARMAEQFPGVQVQGDTIVFPNGTRIDAVMDERGRNDPGWIDVDRQGGVSQGSVHPGQRGSAGGGGGGGGRGGDGGTGAPGTGTSSFSASTSPLEVPAFTEEFSYDPWTRRFEAPKGEEVFTDPGYQFRLQQGQQALERSAAARGTLNTGGTLKDVSEFGQGLASQEYERAYGRRLGEYQQDYGDYLGGYGRALGEYGQRAGIFGQNYQRGLQGFQAAQQVDQFGRSLAQNESQFGRTLGAQESQFGRNLGFNYAGLGANVIQQGARYANPEYTSGADATAAGQVGSANAWQTGLAGIANLGQQTVAGYGSRDPSKWQGVPYR